MRTPRVNLRSFLILCLLLGAVAIPLGYKHLKARREAEIESLEKELLELCTKAAVMRSTELNLGLQPTSFQAMEPTLRRWDKRVAEIEKRLEDLTGRKPERPTVWDDSTTTIHRYEGSLDLPEHEVRIRIE